MPEVNDTRSAVDLAISITEMLGQVTILVAKWLDLSRADEGGARAKLADVDRRLSVAIGGFLPKFDAIFAEARVPEPMAAGPSAPEDALLPPSEPSLPIFVEGRLLPETPVGFPGGGDGTP